MCIRDSLITDPVKIQQLKAEVVEVSKLLSDRLATLTARSVSGPFPMLSPDSSALAFPAPESAPALSPQGGQLIPFSSGRYAIPVEQMRAFSDLAGEEQERVKYLLTLFAQMEAGGIVATSERLGKQLGGIRGYKASNLRTYYYTVSYTHLRAHETN